MLSLEERKRQNSLSEVDKANLKWDEVHGCNFGSSSERKSKMPPEVQFGGADVLINIEKEDRYGHWDEFVRDCARFNDGIRKLIVFCEESSDDEDEVDNDLVQGREVFKSVLNRVVS